MATFVVGDIQGCLTPLRRLLKRGGFDPKSDSLWALGDLVNRGPDSLSTLRFLRDLGADAVLGNHDLHLLAMAAGVEASRPDDSLDAVLRATDREELLDWLRHRPLLQRLGEWTLVHAGIPPQWDIDTAVARAAEVEAALRGSGCEDFLHHMYGNEPSDWNEERRGAARLRLIVNYLTRMRFCDADGRLDLKCLGPPSEAPPNMLPWFAHRGRLSAGHPIAFGHWAALDGDAGADPQLFALDTGCVWGRKLSMLRLEDRRIFSCDCG